MKRNDGRIRVRGCNLTMKGLFLTYSSDIFFCLHFITPVRSCVAVVVVKLKIQGYRFRTVGGNGCYTAVRRVVDSRFLASKLPPVFFCSWLKASDNIMSKILRDATQEVTAGEFRR